MSRLTKPIVLDRLPAGEVPERGALVTFFGHPSAVGIFIGRTSADVDWIAYEASKFAGMAARFDQVQANELALQTVNSETSGVGEQTDEDREELEPLRIQSSIRVYFRNGLPTWIPEDEGGVADSLATDFLDVEIREDVYSREEVALLSATPTATVAELVAWSKIADLTDGSIVALCDASGREELYAFWDGFPDNQRLEVFNPYEDAENSTKRAFAEELEKEARR